MPSPAVDPTQGIAKLEDDVEERLETSCQELHLVTRARRHPARGLKYLGVELLEDGLEQRSLRGEVMVEGGDSRLSPAWPGARPPGLAPGSILLTVASQKPSNSRFSFQ